MIKNGDYIFLTIGRNRKSKIYFDEILYLEADNTYTTIKLQNSVCYVISKPINGFEQMLSAAIFFRISRSLMVNLNHVVEIVTGSNPVLKLINNEILVPDKNKIKQIEEKLHFSQSEQIPFTG